MGNSQVRRTRELDALVPEGRGVDRPGVRRDRLWQVETEGANSVHQILSIQWQKKHQATRTTYGG